MRETLANNRNPAVPRNQLSVHNVAFDGITFPQVAGCVLRADVVSDMPLTRWENRETKCQIIDRAGWELFWKGISVCWKIIRCFVTAQVLSVLLWHVCHACTSTSQGLSVVASIVRARRDAPTRLCDGWLYGVASPRCFSAIKWDFSIYHGMQDFWVR